jgi:hypothetical protein
MGALEVIAGTGVRSSRRYVQQAAPAHNSGSVVWQFRWRAPASDEGRVHFFGAGLSTNNDGTTSFDRVVLARDSVEAPAVLSVRESASRSVDALLPAIPNPSHGTASLEYSLVHASRIELAVFDAQGRRVRMLLSGWQPAGNGQATWDGHREDGSPAGPGVYWARLRVSGSRTIESQRITLTR